MLTLLAVALDMKVCIHCMDVKNAFFNGTLDEEIYMGQPQGFEDMENPNFVCEIKKAVYGLKQFPITWYNTIQPVLETVGVSSCPGDNGIFSGNISVEPVLLGIYLNDLVISCSSSSILFQI